MVCFVLTPRCFAYRHAATTFYQLQRGFGGRRQHARIQEYLSVLFSPQLTLQFTEGFQCFYCWENYTFTLPRIQRRSIIFRGRVSNFFQGWGVQMLMLISIETHIRTCYFPGGNVRTGPNIPLWIPIGECHHNGTIFITVRLLTIIVRHWFVRINNRWFTDTAHVWHLRETQLLEVVVLAIQLFFSPKHPPPQRSESNNIGDWLMQSKKDGKDQE